MTDKIDLNSLGQPVPVAWQVQQVEQNGTMRVKQIVLTPMGVFAFYWDPNEAQLLASKLREGGRAAAAGIWAKATEPTRSGGASTADPSSPSTPESAGG